MVAPERRPRVSSGGGPRNGPTTGLRSDPTTGLPLAQDDPVLTSSELDVDMLAKRWRAQAALRPMTAEAMRGADARAQRMGVSGAELMEAAGAAVAAAVRALLRTAARPAGGQGLILCGPGNNGGDGSVAARHLATADIRSVVVLVSSGARPSTADAARAWDLLDDVDGVERIHAPSLREVSLLLNGIGRAAFAVDALLGTGVRGPLRDPVRTAVDLLERARAEGVPVLAVDTPTALDLTSGEPSDPVVRADVTVTFHRPKQGLAGAAARVLAGRVLVAPIGIPRLADPS